YSFLTPHNALNPIYYLKEYFPIIILCVPFLYMVYQWMYFKISPKIRLLLSICILEMLGIILALFWYNVETRANPFDINFRVFIAAGILAAFVMGIFLDVTMKSLFLGYKISLKKIEFTPSV